MSSITGIGTAVPDFRVSQPEALDFMERQYGASLRAGTLKAMRKIFAHPSVLCRHMALSGWDEARQMVNEDPDCRISRFTEWAVKLASAAARKALDRANASVGMVSGIVVNTCTGYVCPGLSTYLVEELGLSPDVEYYDLVGAGCAGAIPCLKMAEALSRKHPGRAILCVSVEICTATFQMSDDLGLVVSNALFSDAAGACVVFDEGAGLSIVAAASRCEPALRDHIRYVHRQGQLCNSLSAQLPDLVGRAVQDTLPGFLRTHGLTLPDVCHWAMHPGGQKVIDAVQRQTGITDAQLAVTRQVLADYGNASSASIWFALDELVRRGIGSGEWCVMLGFGAGLSVHAQLLRMR